MLFLTASATLTPNIKSLTIQDSDKEPANFAVSIICTHCHEAHDSIVTVDAYEKVEIPGSKGEASFLIKCKFCGSTNYITMTLVEREWFGDVESESYKSQLANRKKKGWKELMGAGVVLAEFDCRGCEVSKFHADSISFEAELESGTKLECKLDDGEWYDYDEKAEEEVSMTESDFQIIKSKGK